MTGASGRALLPDVAPGVLRVRAKRIGFKPGQLAIAVEAGRNTVPILLSDVAMPALDTVRIVGNKAANAVNTRLSEFDRRHMNHEATTSFSREDILKRNVVDTWQLFSNVPSVRYIPDGQALLAISNRGMKVNKDGALPCVMTIMIDGVVMQGDHWKIDPNTNLPDPNTIAYDLARLPPPEDLYGVEVFQRAVPTSR